MTKPAILSEPRAAATSKCALLRLAGISLKKSSKFSAEGQRRLRRLRPLISSSKAWMQPGFLEHKDKKTPKDYILLLLKQELGT